MAHPEQYAFTPSPDGDSIVVSYVKHEGVACRFDRVGGEWLVARVPGGLTAEQAKVVFDGWKATQPSEKR